MIKALIRANQAEMDSGFRRNDAGARPFFIPAHRNPVRSTLPSLLTTLLLTVLLLTAASAQNTADFIILSSPKDFIIYNRFEMPLPPKDLLIFNSNAPLQITEKNSLLGDQITRAFTISYLGQSWYLLKNEEGKPSVKPGSKGEYRTLTNCRVINDTIRITQSGKIGFSRGMRPSGNGKPLESSQKLIRVFRLGDQTYLKKLEKDGPFGWSSLTPQSAWKRFQRETAEQEDLSPALVSKIKSRFREADKVCGVFVEGFNKVSGESKKSPRWSCTAGKTEMKCALSGGSTELSRLEESTKLLLHDIEYILLGKPFKAQHADGNITIGPERP